LIGFTGACGVGGLVWFLRWEYQALFSPQYPKKINTIINTITTQKSLSNVALTSYRVKSQKDK
jgi:hypothetical protein